MKVRIKKSNINERYLTPISVDDRKQYAEEVYNLLYKAYEPLGGLLGINSSDDLIKQSSLWKLVKKNNKIVAAKIYSDKLGGRKTILGGTDGSIEGKKALYKIIQEDIKQSDRKSWGEFSGKMEHIMQKYGAIPIPNSMVPKILGPEKPIINFNPDGYHYTRKIGGIEKEKIMFGNIPDQYKNNNNYNA